MFCFCQNQLTWLSCFFYLYEKKYCLPGLDFWIFFLFFLVVVVRIFLFCFDNHTRTHTHTIHASGDRSYRSLGIDVEFFFYYQNEHCRFNDLDIHTHTHSVYELNSVIIIQKKYHRIVFAIYNRWLGFSFSFFLFRYWFSL